MEVKNTDLMNEMDKVENLKRTIKICEVGRCYIEDVDRVQSWLDQWNNDETHCGYRADDVVLQIHDNRLFLIPKHDNRPIKLIIA